MNAPHPTASQPSAAGATAQSSLRHILLVGGTLAEWAAASRDDWSNRIEALGRVCAQAGVRWLTVRAYRSGDGKADQLAAWSQRVEGCEVVVDPCSDGRQRFAEAMARLDPADEVNEASVAAVLYEPADCEPDLVVIVGPPTQLPPSLVWELAYAELVFVEVPWNTVGPTHLERAVADFGGRRRRFGGLDDE